MTLGETSERIYPVPIHERVFDATHLPTHDEALLALRDAYWAGGSERIAHALGVTELAIDFAESSDSVPDWDTETSVEFIQLYTGLA
jgi:hypothetical protein